MRKSLFPTFLLLLALSASTALASLPFSTVFKGQDRFERLVDQARSGNWKALPIGDRTATVGRALTGTPYKNYTLEIDDTVEAPSVNMNAMDCWTFFEIALAFARLIEEPEANWTPERMLHYIELDRYRGGKCTGDYLSRLHYLEEWLSDNDRRGLVNDITRELGGSSVPHVAREMTVGWKHYRYLRSNPKLLGPLGQMERRVSNGPFYHIPKSRVPAIESKLRNGDIIGIVGRDGRRGYATSHVGLAYRGDDGVLYFMHASAPRNHGKVLIESRLSAYLNKYSSHSGIMVARPVR